MINKNVSLKKLNRDELHRYLGYKSTPDKDIRGIIDECEKTLIETVRPAYIYNIFDIKQCVENSIYKGIEIVGTNLILEGNDIKTHLENCKSVALMCATLSIEADKLIRRMEIKDMAWALIMDMAASVAIEQVCDMTEEDLKEKIGDKYLTYRYGVGYGDLPLYHEKAILSILNTEKLIGLCCNDNNILTPRKSVVCVIGISEVPLKTGRKGCATCNMRESCSYRKKGLSCSY